MHHSIESTTGNELNTTDEKRKKVTVWSRVNTPRKFVTVPRQQLAVALQGGMYSLDDRSARRRLDDRRCPIGLHLVVEGIGAFPLFIGDGLGLLRGFVVAGRVCCCSVLQWTIMARGVLTSSDADSLGWLNLPNGVAPDGRCVRGGAAANPWAPPTDKMGLTVQRCYSSGTRIGWVLSPGTSYERSISSRFLSLFSSRVSHCPAIQSPVFERIGIAERAGTGRGELKILSSRSSDGLRGCGYREESSWKGTSAQDGQTRRGGHGERVQRAQAAAIATTE